MDRKIGHIMMVASLISLSSCQSFIFDGKAPSDTSSLANAIVFTYSNSENKNVTREDFFRFIENMKYVYLDFARGEHKTFSPDTEIIGSGTIIENTEQVSDQFVSHKYKVQFDRENSTVTWVSNPSKIRIITWNFNIEIATVLYLKYDGVDFSSSLELIFGSKKDLQAALGANVKKFWGDHNDREMANATRILGFLKESGQLYNDPRSWDLKEVEPKLK